MKSAKLRICASCEWIFRSYDACPKCGFGHYGARAVVGDKCYAYETTQEPWINKQVKAYRLKLMLEIEKGTQQLEPCPFCEKVHAISQGCL